MKKAAVAVVLLLAALPALADLLSEERTFRAERETRLKAEEGWLSLVGLHWLEPGDTPFGSDPANRVVLTSRGVPPRAGTFVLGAKGVELVEPSGTRRALADDASGRPDVLTYGDARLFVIRRGDRYGIRVKDPNAPARLAFTGLPWFPPSEAWVIRGTFEPYPEPRPLQIPTVLGTTETMLAPGVVRFTVNGTPVSLLPVVEGPDDDTFWFIFRDGTSGKETYGAGRFLYGEAVKAGPVTLNFNRAVSPPCAYTPYATCPLPPKGNVLPVRIEAGEKAAAHP